jgi:DNA-binding response OmpR family regulator
MRILLVQDDPRLSGELSALLRSGAFAVDVLDNGGEAVDLADSEPYNLIILDLDLTGVCGFSILQRLRRSCPRTPLLLLTARTTLQDRVSGLDLGGDDCMLKPFEPEELQARVRALVRRGHGDLSPMLKAGPLVFDLATGAVTIAGRLVPLRLRERAVLHGLMSRLGNVVPKERLAAEVFGYDDPVGPNALEVYVGRLRKKLPPGGPRIRTIHGSGYMLEVA